MTTIITQTTTITGMMRIATETCLEKLLGPPLLFAITSPWWAPHAVLDDDLSNWADFAGPPYADGHDGFLWIESRCSGRRKVLGGAAVR